MSFASRSSSSMISELGGNGRHRKSNLGCPCFTWVNIGRFVLFNLLIEDNGHGVVLLLRTKLNEQSISNFFMENNVFILGVQGRLTLALIISLRWKKELICPTCNFNAGQTVCVVYFWTRMSSRKFSFFLADSLLWTLHGKIQLPTFR